MKKKYYIYARCSNCNNRKMLGKVERCKCAEDQFVRAIYEAVGVQERRSRSENIKRGIRASNIKKMKSIFSN